MKSLKGDKIVVCFILSFLVFVISTSFFLREIAVEAKNSQGEKSVEAGFPVETESTPAVSLGGTEERVEIPSNTKAQTTSLEVESESENLPEPKNDIDIPPNIPEDAITFQKINLINQPTTVPYSTQQDPPLNIAESSGAFYENDCDMAYEYDWSPKSAEMAVKLCHYESSGNPTTFNMRDDHTGWAGCMGSFGLFQINCKYTNINILKRYSSAKHLWQYTTQELRSDSRANIELANWYFKVESNNSFKHWSPCKNNFVGMQNCK